MAHDFKREVDESFRKEITHPCVGDNTGNSEENGFDFYKRQNGRQRTVSEAIRMVCVKDAGARADARSMGGVNEVRGSVEASACPLTTEMITTYREEAHSRAAGP